MAIIIILLSVTGIILNHTEDLELDSHYVKCTAILDWYGIKPPKTDIAFTSNNHWIIQAGEHVYFETKQLLKTSDTLIGVVYTESFFLLGFTHSIIMVSPEAEIIERIEKPLTKIGIDSNSSVFINSEDRTLYSNDALLSWKETDQKPPKWSKPSEIPPDLNQHISNLTRNNILPYERLLLDIHSGRFFGAYGVIIFDIAGILFILLAISGCWMWLRHKFRHHKNLRK